jgi:hypothetical protein
VLSYPSGSTAYNRALIMLAVVLRQRRSQSGTRWRRLNAGGQAWLVVAYSRKGETYTDLACGSRSAPRRSTAICTTVHGQRGSARPRALLLMACAPVRLQEVVPAEWPASGAPLRRSGDSGSGPARSQAGGSRAGLVAGFSLGGV